MTRFNEVTYDASSQTATIGTGLIWDDVYAALAPYGVNVVGGRVSGVGVSVDDDHLNQILDQLLTRLKGSWIHTRRRLLMEK